jgi:pyrrolysine biosynthesis protein PylC
MGENNKTVAVIGGKLQGLETIYLAEKAGMKTWLIDKKNQVPATGLCDRFFCFDVTKQETELIDLLKQADLILPAMENQDALDALVAIAVTHQLALAFDPHAYAISSSKRRSDCLIANKKIPAPRYFPDCEPPYVVKPSEASGSEGVRMIETKEEMEAFFTGKDRSLWVAQEFLEGPSYSIEIIGRPGAYRVYEITEIHMDETYDCKRVTAPCDLPEALVSQMEALAVRLADSVSLHGIMDVEVIEHQGRLKVLEIDARIPSQTPTVVYHATGRNEIKDLVELFHDVWPLDQEEKKRKPARHSSFLHLLVGDGKIRCLGEHIMGSSGALKLLPGFCEADEALTDYAPGSELWRGTFIHTAEDPDGLELRKKKTLESIRALMGADLPFVDSAPSRLLPK